MLGDIVFYKHYFLFLSVSDKGDGLVGARAQGRV